ncbi:hypothetical protein B566_EDAN002798 [Ephemera danica]|nr:hypothetical protein B566_EDAN002798 [Ephemera danica]
MSAKAIREATGKALLNQHLPSDCGAAQCRFASVDEDTKWEALATSNPWLKNEKLVVKPDQLIKRRGKLGLIEVNADLPKVQSWVQQRISKDVKIGKASGKLRNFIIEPFLPHKPEEEAYVCIYSHRHGDTILFHHEGGVDIGDVDSKAVKLEVPVGQTTSASAIQSALLKKVDAKQQPLVAKFIDALYQLYVDLYFTYLEINPLVITGGQVHILDLAAKLDATADFLCRAKWGEIEYPPPFGRDAYPEEAYIADLDAKSGASLKLTILNKMGRIWTMVAGGGASVIYSDTICDLGGASELANYGEYSGAPSEQQTYEYAKTILGLMCQNPHPDGKVLIIGGGIANFTNVAATFKGIVTALQEFQAKLMEYNNLGIPLFVFGPETHMTAIVGMALGKRPIPRETEVEFSTANFLLPGGQDKSGSTEELGTPGQSRKGSIIAGGATNNNAGAGSAGAAASAAANDVTDSKSKVMFTKHSKAIVWGMQTRAVQSMLDFDFVCRRTEPSVVAMVYPFTGDHKQKFYWGHKEVLINGELILGQSLVVADGIPENLTRKLILTAQQKGVSIIGPATVGGIKPGCFKIGNTGGMMDNILHSKLYRPGSVAYVSRSGGMSNELNNIVSKATNGVLEGVAIGGDRYPGTNFMDHILRYQADPQVKMIVLLGEVGGTEEYDFGHAGSCAQSEKETAASKNAALASAGATVPQSFDNLGDAIHDVYRRLVEDGTIVPEPELPPPTVPMDYSWARSMLDFDFVCRRTEPSVVAMVYPFTGDHKQKFYWGHKEVLINGELILGQSLVVADGIPENLTRKLILTAQQKGVSIIGPATVGGIKPGCFKIGNTGGMMDNILHSKLYRPGSVAYVSRSGGMSNELNNIVSKATNGVLEGVAIGGDRYPGTNFMDHILRYQADPQVKMIVLLGEVGGTEEYDFGHAGSCAQSEKETAASKNAALASAGATVPQSFDNLGDAIHDVYRRLVEDGTIVPEPELPPPTVPMDYSWARELGLIRKPASFMTSICDERGQELLYAGIPISDVLKQDMGLGGVISLLWFQRALPPYVCKFFEMCLMVTADHGPAVSGAHNTIVCARAGKDLVSSLVSGLLTVGDRFGGALDGAARQFSEAYDTGLIPMDFIIKEFVLENFPATPLLKYALEVEKITTSKKPNLILNVDGVIAVAFVDLLRNCGSFSREEAQEYIEMGSINSLFVLGRSIGFIGHYMDQKRLRQGLYRHPWDDISYVLPEQYN